MILDTVSNIAKYQSLNPRFKAVVDFLEKNSLEELSLGKHQILGDEVYVNICEAQPKKREEAKLESHRVMIDIQIPISGGEEHGYSPVANLSEAEYDSDNDILFYPEEGQAYFTICPGQFVVYFPQDGHAPAITDKVLRKAIFKVKM